jgi:hypothetical protein
MSFLYKNILEIRRPDQLSVSHLCFERGRLSLPCGSVVHIQGCGRLRSAGLRSGGLSFRSLAFNPAQSTLSTLVDTLPHIHIILTALSTVLP